MNRLLSVAMCAAVFAASAETWDFTKGCPQGMKPGKATEFSAKGMTARDFDKVSEEGGVRLLKGTERLPEAFRLEAVFVPTAPRQLGKRYNSCLYDDMYVSQGNAARHGGMQLLLSHDRDRWQPLAYLGFGDETVLVYGPSVRLEPGVKTKLSMVYDANRRIGWELGGEKMDAYLKRDGQLAVGTCRRTLGDRFGSNFMTSEVPLESISIDPVKREPLGFATTVGRRAFLRGETEGKIGFRVCNFTKAPVENLKVTMKELSSEGVEVANLSTAVAAVAPGKDAEFSLPVETRIRPGDAKLLVRLTAKTAAGEVALDREIAISICPARNPSSMVASMWGFNGFPVAKVAELGFTHALEYGLGYNTCPKADTDPSPVLRRLDEALRAGVGLEKSMSIEYPNGENTNRYWRLKRDGSLAKGVSSRPHPVPEVSNPDFLKQARKTALRNCELYGDHPAFAGVLPCSEGRDDSASSCNYEAKAYKEATGRELPEFAASRYTRTASARDTDRKYPDGIIPEDDEYLKYFRWFWKGGDGWPGYVSAVADAYREGVKGRGDFFSFWDPATRCPPLWGSGGSADYLNQWIYAVPEPMNVAAAGEEMMAMVAGRPGQEAMIMTQLICYRIQIAPTNVVVSPAPAWLGRRPLADFPTIPPDSLSEATWSMIAKPVKGIMYHGWGTIVETGTDRGYVFTNPETTVRLKELLTGPVAELGPSLKVLGRRDGEFVILESATTALMGGPATWGWMTPAITFAQRARLDPRVVYEETILRDGFGAAKVVYAPQLKYLTEPVLAKLKDFQRQGGLIVGDADMLKALKPDLTVPVMSFRAPESDQPVDVDANEAKAAGATGDVKTREGTLRMKAKMQQDGEELRKALAAKGYRPRVDSSNADIVVYERNWNKTPYVIAINDKRTFGDYVGQWGKTMEKGLPNSGEVYLDDPEGAVKGVYELSEGRELRFVRKEGRVAVDLEWKLNDGRMLAFLPERIEKVKLQTVDGVEKGGELRLRFSVLGRSGKPIPAVLPVEVRVQDARGRELDGAGYAAAVDGVCEFSVRTNLDDAEGDYTVFCKDRASGLTATAKVVRGARAGFWSGMMRKLRGENL